jgi:hypothetical protein
MKNLQHTLVDNNLLYESEIHYKFFMCEKPTKKTKKEKIKKTLFLTFEGFMRVIYISKNDRFKNSNIICSWLHHNFNDNYDENFVIDSIKNNIKIKEGYVYCVTAETINHVKIGFWKGSKKTLAKRYGTYYGNDLNLFCCKTSDARHLEKLCHFNFKKYNISNELFIKEHLEEYKTFISKNKI